MENIVCNYELTSAPRSFFGDLNHGGEGKSKLVHVIRDGSVRSRYRCNAASSKVEEY